MRGFAALTAAMSVDFPAFGKPTSAASARSFTSSFSQCSSPNSPCSAKLGARRRFERKRAFPRPPWPPCAATNESPCCTRSASTWPSRTRTTVPSGTVTTRSLPRAPCRLPPCPCFPDSARRWGWSRNASNDAVLRSARTITSPPSPPSPPSGPPFGTCASRRNDIAPAPPSPPRRLHWTSSTNADCTNQAYGRDASVRRRKGCVSSGARSAGRVSRPARARQLEEDVDELAALAATELHGAGGGREQRVVVAATDVLTRVELRAALPDDDRAGLHRLS